VEEKQCSGKPNGLAKRVEGRHDEAGFTLVELMVVLLVMGILLAIAIPTFLGVTKGANDRSTQSNLTNAMTAAKTIFAQSGAYPTTLTMVSDLKTSEPELNYTTKVSTKATTLSVSTSATGKILTLSDWMTKTTACWVAKDNETSNAATAGVRYGVTATKATGTKTCLASSVAPSTYATSYPAAPSGH
jgi:type IV pilus assembly protein PilA